MLTIIFLFDVSLLVFPWYANANSVGDNKERGVWVKQTLKEFVSVNKGAPVWKDLAVEVGKWVDKIGA